MKIRYVEELVGITKKNIRFYEEEGLLSPGRAENGYREYSENDVKRLKQIKFLRKLYVPVEAIRSLLQGKSSLEDCLQRHLAALDKRRHDLDEIRRITSHLLSQTGPEAGLSLDSLDIDSCLEDIAKLEKEGRRFMNIDIQDVHRKKTIGAAGGALIFIALMAFFMVAVLLGNAEDPLPPLLFAVILAIPVILIICVISALAQRVKEIKGGEEDEAAKY